MHIEVHIGKEDDKAYVGKDDDAWIDYSLSETDQSNIWIIIGLQMQVQYLPLAISQICIHCDGKDVWCNANGLCTHIMCKCVNSVCREICNLYAKRFFANSSLCVYFYIAIVCFMYLYASEHSKYSSVKYAVIQQELANRFQ